MFAILVFGIVVIIPAGIGFYHVVDIVTQDDIFGPQPTTTVVDGEYIAFELESPETAMSGSHVETEGDCTYVHYRMTNFRLFVKALKKDCKVPNDQDIQNGNHGSYKTLDDVPAPLGVEEVDTGLGRAEVFTQKYSEYTNSSNHYEEPVAIVTFDRPVNPDFPTMVFFSARGDMSRAEFTTIVKNLQPVSLPDTRRRRAAVKRRRRPPAARSTPHLDSHEPLQLARPLTLTACR